MRPARDVRRGRGEQGAILFVSSVLVVAMCALAALGVDIANVWQVRRHAQNAADAAALAAAQDLPNLNNAIATAKTYAQRNFNVATSHWNGCRDSGALAVTPDMAANDNQCISFSSDSGRVRVKIPSRTVSTFFGGVVGVASFQVQAGAIAASVVNLEDRMIPAAVTDLAGSGLVCVEQAGNNQPCAARERGRFGSLKSPRLNVYKASSGPNSADTLAINYAMSLDHNIIPYAGGTRVCDGNTTSPCATSNMVNKSSIANHLVPSSGNDIPPVTEGFVTGFTANTTDFGSVTFCGRLQRPDMSQDNLLDPRPNNCNSPGTPTTTILGKTVNGRHVYFWMNDAAKQKFYPEVTALGLPDTHPSLAIGNSIYNNGDVRLDCFLAGYSFNTSTGVETIPDCRSVDLIWPGQEGITENVADTFSAVSYSNNNGSQLWSNGWVEGGGDEGSPSGGRITVSSGRLRFSINGSTYGRWISRTANLQGATSASLSFKAYSAGGSARITVFISPDGATFTPLTVISSTNAPGWTDFNIPITSYASATTYLALQVTQTSNTDIYFDDFDITYTVDPVNPVIATVAPIFEIGIRNDTRWAVVPLIDGWNGNDAIPVEGFWASFAYTAYVSNSKVQAFDAWVFDPALVEADPSSSSFVYGFSPRPTARLIK